MSADQRQATERFDLISVGSGAGGLAAALTAAEDGASVLVVEKDELFGGVTGRSAPSAPTTHRRRR